MNNHEIVTKGFNILVRSLSVYIARELQIEYKDHWWQDGVMDILSFDQKRDLPAFGEWETLVDSLDIQRCLVLFDRHWNNVFRRKLPMDNRTWAKELMGVRNKWAHVGGKDFTDNDTWRALDTMARLCEQIDQDGAEEIRTLLRTTRYGTEQGSAAMAEAAVVAEPKKNGKAEGILKNVPLQGLPSWRDVIEPHPDVRRGEYKNAEFAADLSQVARGDGAIEYRDPVEFFSRTYITEGMASLLEQAFRRVTGKGGEPVIQLKTAFGGGKTHSMLALYHALRGEVSLDKIPLVKPIVQAAGMQTLPKATIAVLVGTALSPAKTKRLPNLPGITVNTLWGEMAAQLAIAAGKPELYDFVRDADRMHVAPGSEDLKKLFDACGPCLILMDELVAYARTLYGQENLPGGTFENFITFTQQITEAARASQNSLVVAAIPESNVEIGGEAGHRALDAIEKTFGRMEAIWKPVTATEGYEVVRRRLFLECKDPAARDLVCSNFSKMYLENTSDFPIETKELAYKKRLISCYPIHPEVFDRLYGEWATLEKFQRTRGVLRLMAAVIHELWMGNDAGLLIMPGSIPLNVPAVRDELIRYLESDDGWNAIVDHEVDGRDSVPYKKDQEVQRYGNRLAARRVARTIFLGSAPSSRSQAVRGIAAERIRLGIVQPGETISDFNDALGTLSKSLTYLYVNDSGNRFWFDTRPTLRKMVEDRASQYTTESIDFEIEQWIKHFRKEAPFGRLHTCPASSQDVPDEQTVGLVLLRPQDTFRQSLPDAENIAVNEAEKILNNRGSAPRIYRNMLVFVAPDYELIKSVRAEMRMYLAWSSMYREREQLNLDATQNRDVESNVSRSKSTVELRICEAYCWLLVPSIDRLVDIKTIVWEKTKIPGGSELIIKKAAKSMIQSEAIITKWAPALLRMQLDQLLWKESSEINIKKLWEQLCTYCYLPRLADYSVFEAVIRTGLNSKEYFALAAAIGNNRYIDLRFNQPVYDIDKSAYLVKVDAAIKQISSEQQGLQSTQPDEAPTPTAQANNGDQSPVRSGASTTIIPPPAKAPRSFFLSASLDNTRINRDVQRLVEEVISHLSISEGCEIEISLEVSAKAPVGFSVPTVRTVLENCSTLKVKDFGFED